MGRKKAKSEKLVYQQLYDGEWYQIDDSYSHICCDCGLTHSVYFKLEDGVIYTRWDVDPKETARVRRITKAEDAKDA